MVQRNQHVLLTVFSFAVYQLARQNVVIPVLSRFGRFLKTHRLLRQYLWLGILPYFFAT